MHGPESCASCNKTDCHLSFVSRNITPVAERTAWILDEAWPEHREFLTGQWRDDDQVLTPGVWGKTLNRYDWGRGKATATWQTGLRHLTMRQVARARGAVRQAAYLRCDAALAGAMARRIDYRARHVVVSQTLLPFLWRDGVLGGRSFDVLMTRYPLADIHARLDAVHARHPDSATIADFRAPQAVVDAETEALGVARRIVTPHHDLAEGFGARALWLDWRKPVVRPRRAGARVAFVGPVITRQGAREVRNMARGLAEPLIVFGADLEGAGFWDSVAVERRTLSPAWLDDIGVLLHPAAMTAAPRRLLEAVAHGVIVYAEPSCGLAPGQFRALDEFDKQPAINFPV